MVKNYDPKLVTCIIGGKIMSGFADGTFIKLERNEQAYNLKVGVDGEGARAKNNNKSGKITLTLMQTSSSNDVLSSYASADELSGAGAVPFLMKDANGSSKAAALTCWVQKLPDLEDAKEITMRTWVLETDELEMFVGGNNR
jgi:hypothetical protein